jgi:DNA modification methylase
MSKFQTGLHNIPLSELHESPSNPREISDEAFERLKKSLDEAPEMLQARPLIATLEGEVICGNMRLRALKALGEDDAFVFVADLSENERREWLIRDNNEYGDWVQDQLAELVSAHAEAGGNLELLGFAQPEVDELLAYGQTPEDPDPEPSRGPTLSDRFGFPPFTVLDARSWPWRQRKKEWLGLGIRSELGREGVRGSISKGDPSAGDPEFYEKKTAKEAELGRELTTEEFRTQHYVDPRSEGDTSLSANSTSVFDPTLSELVYRWFSAEGQQVIDPFAGGSVRGIVAAKLGRDYFGVDLRQEQVEANRDQAREILDGSENGMAVWDCSDARAIGPDDPDERRGDLLFTCPPYFNMEVYSDDERDLSRAPDFDAFLEGYRECLAPAVELLNDDRFAVVVVGDVRQKNGRVLPLAAVTIRIMQELGLDFYNEAVYISPVGSLRIRAARYFVESRKLGRTHQSVLCFVKGDGKAAAEAAGEVDRLAMEEAVEASSDDDGSEDDAGE